MELLPVCSDGYYANDCVTTPKTRHPLVDLSDIRCYTPLLNQCPAMHGIFAQFGADKGLMGVFSDVPKEVSGAGYVSGRGRDYTSKNPTKTAVYFALCAQTKW